MTRRSTFTVDAASVQGNEGATVTFRSITIDERQEYLDRPDVNDITMLRAHLAAWSGFVDDDGKPLPDPSTEPGAVGALYMEEMRELFRLMWRGPLGDEPKN